MSILLIKSLVYFIDPKLEQPELIHHTALGQQPQPLVNTNPFISQNPKSPNTKVNNDIPLVTQKFLVSISYSDPLS